MPGDKKAASIEKSDYFLVVLETVITEEMTWEMEYAGSLNKRFAVIIIGNFEYPQDLLADKNVVFCLRVENREEAHNLIRLFDVVGMENMFSLLKGGDCGPKIEGEKP